MTSTSTRETASPAPNCCVVQVETKTGSVRPNCACANLTPEIMGEIEKAAATWRDAKYVIERLEAIRERERLPGVAVWYAHPKYAAEIPPPLSVPFEPFELDEGRSPLAELIGSAAAGDPEQFAALRTSRWRRAIVRIGVPSIILVSQLPNAITQIAVHRNAVALWLWAGVLLSMIAAAAIVWWMSDQWLIVPGGVVIRRSVVGGVGQSLTLFTPADSTLIVRPQQSINALELWRGSKMKRRLATRLETAALLAAWQSTIPPPDPARLSDLM